MNPVISFRSSRLILLTAGLLVTACRKEAAPNPASAAPGPDPAPAPAAAPASVPAPATQKSAAGLGKEQVAAKAEEWIKALTAAKGNEKAFAKVYMKVVDDPEMPPAEIFKIVKVHCVHDGHKAGCYVKVMNRVMASDLAQAIEAFEPLRDQSLANASGYALARLLGEKDPKRGAEWIKTFPESPAGRDESDDRDGACKYSLTYALIDGVVTSAETMPLAEVESVMRELAATGEFNERARRVFVNLVGSKLAERGLVDRKTWAPIPIGGPDTRTQ